ncbi:MAG: hypothetical protein ACOC3V_03665 [bacterium]
MESRGQLYTNAVFTTGAVEAISNELFAFEDGAYGYNTIQAVVSGGTEAIYTVEVSFDKGETWTTVLTDVDAETTPVSTVFGPRVRVSGTGSADETLALHVFQKEDAPTDATRQEITLTGLKAADAPAAESVEVDNPDRAFIVIDVDDVTNWANAGIEVVSSMDGTNWYVVGTVEALDETLTHQVIEIDLSDINNIGRYLTVQFAAEGGAYTAPDGDGTGRLIVIERT